MEEHVARAALDLWQAEISPDTAYLLKRNLVDSYAGICASLLDRRMVATLANYAALNPDEKGVAVWGGGGKAHPPQAVFLNAILGRRSDLVNTYLSPRRMGGNHPSDNVALLLTLADWKKLGGRDLLRAMHAAYVLSCAFSDYYDPEAAGYDHDAAAPLYTALVAGLLEGLDKPGLVEAQRIAGAMGLDPDQAGVGLVTDWKHCTYASSALRGLEAALMAKAGFKGPVDIYEGEAGWNRFLPHGERFLDPPPDLGAIAFKRWQALVFCQTAIDAAVELTPRFRELDPKRVTAVRLDTYGKALHEAGGEASRRPASRAGRTHSLPYCVAAALLEGGVGYESFSGQAAGKEDLRSLMDKVVLGEDEAMTEAYPRDAPCRITIEVSGGDPLTVFKDRPRGDPASPLSDGEIGAKAALHLGRLVPVQQAESLIGRLWEVEKEDGLSWLISPLQKGVAHD